VGRVLQLEADNDVRSYNLSMPFPFLQLNFFRDVYMVRFPLGVLHVTRPWSCKIAPSAESGIAVQEDKLDA
jgi:hypothetical protein